MCDNEARSTINLAVMPDNGLTREERRDGGREGEGGRERYSWVAASSDDTRTPLNNLNLHVQYVQCK